MRILPINLLVPHYLSSSYCYYHLNWSPMTDSAYDLLCVRLRTNFADITHVHKPLVEYESLLAGSCFLPMAEFPQIVRQSADVYMSRAVSGEMSADLLSRYGEVQQVRQRRTRPSIPLEEKVSPVVRIRRVSAAPTVDTPPTTPRVRRVRPSA